MIAPPDAGKPAPGDRAAAEFVDRVKRERAARGLPPSIVDDNTLRVIASLAARRPVVPHDSAA